MPQSEQWARVHRFSGPYPGETVHAHYVQHRFARHAHEHLVIGLVEFLAVLQIAFADPEWLIGDQVRATGYLFAALVFWSLCFGLSRTSARIDRRMRTG